MPGVSSAYACVAWFKLAECVRRSEKERALSVYKLLVHSLHDDAIAWQLKGDIFSMFDMSEQAVSAYQEAASQFTSRGKHAEAAYAHECIVFHNHLHHHSYQILVRWYAEKGVIQRAFTLAQKLIQALIAAGYVSWAYEMLHTYTAYFTQAQTAQLYEMFIQQALQQPHGSADRTMIHSGIATTIDVYRKVHDEQAIEQFIDTLSSLDQRASEYAYTHYENG